MIRNRRRLMSENRSGVLPRRGGFTLIESIATIVVLGAIGSVISFMMLGVTDGYLEANTRSQIHTEASVAMDRMIREIRGIAIDDSASSIAPDIATATTTQLIYDASAAQINYAAGEVTILSGGITETLIEDVSSFSFTFLDESNADLGQPLSGAGADPVRRVEIDFTITRGGVSERLRTRAFIRSTMSDA